MTGRGAPFVVGLIADTHGLLRPEALDALAGSDHIVHAGDIGDPAIVERLASLAPLTAIRGNNDTGAWARRLRGTETLELAGVRIHVVHALADLAVDCAAQRIAVVVSGHSHKPAIERRPGVLCVNPGSAGPRRFALPVCVARLVLARGEAQARILELAVAPAKKRRAV